MRRVQQDDLVPPLWWVLQQLVLDVRSKRIHQARVHRPPVNDAPLYRALGVLLLEPLPPLPQLVQRAARRRARVLRILCERYGATAPALAKTVLEQLVVHLLRQRICVAKRDVWLVRRSLRGELVEELAHLGVLMLRPFPDRRASADVRILFLDLRRPALGYVGPDVVL